MIKISRLADYATVLMSVLARNGNCLASADLAAQTRITLPTVRKVMKLLHEQQLVQSIQGAAGGYQLIKSPEAISVVDIIAAIDGVPAMTECVKTENSCDQLATCGLSGNWKMINQLVINTLKRVSLADMIAPMEKPLVFHAMNKKKRGHNE